MTQNQIAYQRNLEDARHNLELERLNAASLEEQKRAAKEREAIQRLEIETNRQLQEARNALTAQSIAQQDRASMRNYIVGQRNADVNEANHYLAVDQHKEVVRSNIAKENLAIKGHQVDMAIAEVNDARKGESNIFGLVGSIFGGVTRIIGG